jgi:hypothetical protein
MLFDRKSQLIDVPSNCKTSPACAPFLLELSLDGCSTIVCFVPNHLTAHAGGR